MNSRGLTSMANHLGIDMACIGCGSRGTYSGKSCLIEVACHRPSIIIKALVLSSVDRK